MEDSVSSSESPSGDLLNLSPPLSPRPAVPSRVSASAGSLIDGCNGLSMDTPSRQSIPAILTWLENSLPAHQPEIGGGGEIRGRRMRGKYGRNNEVGAERCSNIDITAFLAVIKLKSINEINSYKLSPSCFSLCCSSLCL